MNDTIIHHITKFEQEKQGKQGITGIVEINRQLFVYKISQYLNYLTEHEYLILKGVEQMCTYNPHFCSNVFMKSCKIHPEFKEEHINPFESSEKPLEIDVLFMEYIPQSIPLYSLIRKKSIPISHIMSSIKQVLVAISVAQTEKHLVHYDLHSLNILMRECRYDDVHVYIIDEQNTLCIPTYGHISTIIDFGFSYSDDLLQHPSFLSLAYTDVGYMSPAFDPVADMKLLLVSLADDFRNCRPKSEDTNTFTTIIHNLFRPLSIDWLSGWDKTNEVPIIDRVFRELEQYTPSESKLFVDMSHLCMDILPSLITLPLKQRSGTSLANLKIAYSVICREFVKIETEINNTFYSLYIFRKMVDIARNLRPTYESNPKSTIRTFKNELFDAVRAVVKFCRFKDVSFDALLCALYSFSYNLEHQLYVLLSEKMIEKYKKYMDLQIQSISHILPLIDINFEDQYVFNDRSRIRVYDVPNKRHYEIECSSVDPNRIHTLNQLPSYYRGSYITTHLQPPEKVSEQSIPVNKPSSNVSV